MSGELVNLKIAISSLSNRVKLLETFILKQFGNVLNLDVGEKQNLGISTSTPASCNQKPVTPSGLTSKNTSGSSSTDFRPKRCRSYLVKKLAAAASISKLEQKNAQEVPSSNSSFNVDGRLVPESTKSNNSSILNTVIIKEESLICPECKLMFVESADLEDHLRTSHSSHSDKSVPTTGVFNDSFGEITWEFIHTSRGKTLCVNDFIFKVKRTQDHKCYYYCRDRDCSSSVQTWNDELIVSTLKEKHTHPNNATEIQDLKIMEAVRKRAADEPDIPMPVLYREERQRVEETYGSEVAARMPSFTTLYRERGPKPKRPRTKPKFTMWAKAKAKSDQLINRSISIPGTSVANTSDFCQQ